MPVPCVYERCRLKGGIVTIDAMGCQYKIVDQIREAGADYLFSLKGNQETLRDDVEEYLKDVDFKNPKSGIKVTITHDLDHGRIERRSHAITDDVAWLIARHPAWVTINNLAASREVVVLPRNRQRV
jgi:predicted transposase YbfD/YdcC